MSNLCQFKVAVEIIKAQTAELKLTLYLNNNNNNNRTMTLKFKSLNGAKDANAWHAYITSLSIEFLT